MRALLRALLGIPCYRMGGRRLAHFDVARTLSFVVPPFGNGYSEVIIRFCNKYWRKQTKYRAVAACKSRVLRGTTRVAINISHEVVINKWWIYTVV